MTEPRIPKKNEALLQLRAKLKRCSKCGVPWDSVEANSHLVDADDATSVRFYFQFLHGKKECIDFTLGRDFDRWLETAIAKYGI